MDDHFEVVFHHGGRFESNGSLQYIGQLSILACDPDRWSYFEIWGILKEMGYAHVKEMWYAVGGGSVLEGKLELLSDDRGACHMVNIVILNGQVHLYVVHKVDEAEVVNLLEYHPVVEEGDVHSHSGGNPKGDVRVGVQVQNEDDGEEVDEGVQVQSEEDGDKVHGAVHTTNEEHGGEVDVLVEIVIEEHGCEVDGAVEIEIDEGVQNEEDKDGGEVDGRVEVENEEDGCRVHVENANEEDVDKDDVSSCSDSKGDSFIEEDLLDVSIHTYEDEDDSWDGDGRGSVDFGGVSGQNNHAGDRGLSDTDWASESLNSVEYSDCSGDDRDSYGNFGIFSMPKSMEGYNWDVGTYFTEKEEFVEAIRTYGVYNGRKLKNFRNDKRRICVKCLGAKGTCKWYAYCAYKAAQSTWQLRRIINDHTYSREFNIRMITSKWLSQRLEKNIRDNPDIKLTNIRNRVGRKWNIGISRTTAHRAKKNGIQECGRVN